MILPPLHPLLVNFTAALLPVSVLSDLAGRVLRKPSLNNAGWWTLLYAVLITPLTAFAGWYWLKQMSDMDHSQMGIHKWLGTGLALVLPALLWFRWRSYRQAASPGWTYLTCTGFVVAALVLQGHLGAVMSFNPDAPPESTRTPAMTGSTHQMDRMQHIGARTQPTIAPIGKQLQWKDHLDVSN